MLEKIFAPGQRKIVAFLVGVALTLFGDRLGITMTDEVQQSLITLIGIFTGGNVLSKFAFAMDKKVAPVESFSPSAPPIQQAEDSDLVLGEIVRVENYAKQIAKDATAELNKVHKRCKVIEDHMTKQSQSINDLLAMFNKQAPPAGPGRVPTPNELYQG